MSTRGSIGLDGEKNEIDHVTSCGDHVHPGCLSKRKQVKDKCSCGQSLVSTLIFKAITSGNMKRLLKNLVDAQSVNSKGYCPLVVAAEMGRHEMIPVLIDAGAQVCEFAIIAASSLGNLRALDALFGKGAVGIKIINYESALAVAATTGQLAVVKYLIELRGSIEKWASADPDMAEELQIRKTEFLETTSMVAAGEGNVHVLEYMMARGVAMSVRDNFAIAYAAEKGQCKAVKWLIRHGADVNAVDSHGKTPLMYAVIGGHVDTVVGLIGHGADATNVDENGCTALMWAAERGDADVVTILCDHGANVAAVNKAEQSALMLAVLYGHVDVITVLISNGADVTDVEEFGFSALMLAAAKGHVDVVTSLIGYGADVNAVDEHEMTALMFAASQGHAEVITFLIEHGASVKAVNDIGESALMFAVSNGHVDVSTVLISHGADVADVVEDGWKAFRI